MAERHVSILTSKRVSWKLAFKNNVAPPFFLFVWQLDCLLKIDQLLLRKIKGKKRVLKTDFGSFVVNKIVIIYWS